MNHFSKQSNALWFLILLVGLMPNFMQAEDIERIEPPFWWVDMANEDLQLMIYGENAGLCELKIKHKKVRISKIHKVENPNYLIVDLNIPKGTPAQHIDFELRSNKGVIMFHYELRERKQENKRLMGLDASDQIYLLMPDRFANGKKENDKISSLNETTVDRTEMYKRHGGDLEGIRQKLPYLKDLGINTLWLNPVLTNDQPEWSYHGYACTDHYNIDPRFGSNQEFIDLVDEMHRSEMKMVMDIIHNHIGDQHWTFKDLPMKDWVHQHKEFTRTIYKSPVVFDPYGSNGDKSLLIEGWFDKHMPDLNQDNPYVSKYLIQNNIWWIELAGIDGLRLDTYYYSDPAFLLEWIKVIKSEFPNIGIFGENWVHGEAVQAYFHGENILDNDFDSGLPGLMDFQFHFALIKALTEDFGWTEGLNRLYYNLAKDYLLKDANHNVTFLDNHDLSRYYSMVGEDFDKYKMGLGYLYTTRGIPCMYYGTEILMKNFSEPDGLVRSDFPGGWEADSTNKFSAEGRNEQEQAAFSYVKKLLNWRQDHPVISSGKLMQFIPLEGTYVYFRYNDQETIMVVMNSNKEPVELDCRRFQERMHGFSTAYDVMQGNKDQSLESITVPAVSTLILELK